MRSTVALQTVCPRPIDSDDRFAPSVTLVRLLQPLLDIPEIGEVLELTKGDREDTSTAMVNTTNSRVLLLVAFMVYWND